jgi:hypothetical protein
MSWIELIFIGLVVLLIFWGVVSLLKRDGGSWALPAGINGLLSIFIMMESYPLESYTIRFLGAELCLSAFALIFASQIVPIRKSKRKKI